MTDQDLRATIKAMADVCKQCNTQEKALAFLVEMGLVNEAGELTEPYR
jgi:hypothetical protein